MKVEKIYSIESQNLSEIHLVRDSKFWQAWERSSFLFSKLFRPFKINARFFKNISAEMVYLGFPDTLLAKIQEECDGKYSYKVIDEKLRWEIGLRCICRINPFFMNFYFLVMCIFFIFN